MTAKIIVDAAISTLEKLGYAAFVGKIYETIVTYNLYRFGAKDP